MKKKTKRIKGWAVLRKGNIWRWYQDGSKRTKIYLTKEMAERYSDNLIDKIYPCEITIKS